MEEKTSNKSNVQSANFIEIIGEISIDLDYPRKVHHCKKCNVKLAPAIFSDCNLDGLQEKGLKVANLVNIQVSNLKVIKALEKLTLQFCSITSKAVMSLIEYAEKGTQININHCVIECSNKEFETLSRRHTIKVNCTAFILMDPIDTILNNILDNGNFIVRTQEKLLSHNVIKTIMNFASQVRNQLEIDMCQSQKEWLDGIQEFYLVSGKGTETVRSPINNALLNLLSKDNFRPSLVVGELIGGDDLGIFEHNEAFEILLETFGEGTEIWCSNSIDSSMKNQFEIVLLLSEKKNSFKNEISIVIMN